MLVVGRARLRPLAGWRRDQTLGESTDNPAPPGPEPVDDAKSNSRLWMTLAEHLFDAWRHAAPPQGGHPRRRPQLHPSV